MHARLTNYIILTEMYLRANKRYNRIMNDVTNKNIEQSLGEKEKLNKILDALFPPDKHASLKSQKSEIKLSCSPNPSVLNLNDINEAIGSDNGSFEVINPVSLSNTKSDKNESKRSFTPVSGSSGSNNTESDKIQGHICEFLLQKPDNADLQPNTIYIYEEDVLVNKKKKKKLKYLISSVPEIFESDLDVSTSTQEFITNEISSINNEISLERRKDFIKNILRCTTRNGHTPYLLSFKPAPPLEEMDFNTVYINDTKERLKYALLTPDGEKAENDLKLENQGILQSIKKKCASDNIDLSQDEASAIMEKISEDTFTRSDLRIRCFFCCTCYLIF